MGQAGRTVQSGKSSKPQRSPIIVPAYVASEESVMDKFLVPVPNNIPTTHIVDPS